ncbi:MAG: protein-disulfide reductase DsbD N-terminal domain-containing protein [Gammaproteobacteria bacterium]|nr:protein-disulfide reductase DsbD N-terminal domain-containing protein [Gammaproteobacteria bacterium]
MSDKSIVHLLRMPIEFLRRMSACWSERAGRRSSPWWALCLACVLSPTVQAVDIEDLLKPEQAFVLSVTAKDPTTIVAQWTIAEGYYLYRERFRFTSATPGIQLGEPGFPVGQPKQDEFFGPMEIYRRQVAVALPVLRGDGGGDDLQLTAISQGCADIGVCYPPQTQRVTISLPEPREHDATAEQAAPPLHLGGNVPSPAAFAGDPVPTSSSTPAANPVVAENDSLFGVQRDDLLPPEQVFVLSITTPDPQTVQAHWTIAEDHYLYRERLTLELLDAEGIHITALDIPHGEPKEDEFFGRQEVFHREVRLTAHLERADTQARDIQVQVGYQGCAEKRGVCYPPQRQSVPLTLAASRESVSAAERR